MTRSGPVISCVSFVTDQKECATYGPRLQWNKEKVEIKVVSLTVVGVEQAKV